MVLDNEQEKLNAIREDFSFIKDAHNMSAKNGRASFYFPHESNQSKECRFLLWR